MPNRYLQNWLADLKAMDGDRRAQSSAASGRDAAEDAQIEAWCDDIFAAAGLELDGDDDD